MLSKEKHLKLLCCSYDNVYSSCWAIAKHLMMYEDSSLRSEWCFFVKILRFTQDDNNLPSSFIFCNSLYREKDSKKTSKKRKKRTRQAVVPTEDSLKFPSDLFFYYYKGIHYISTWSSNHFIIEIDCSWTSCVKLDSIITIERILNILC